MKKTALTLLGVLALSSAAFAQTTGTTPAAAPAMITGNVKPATIVVVDVGYVFDNYVLAKAYNVQFTNDFQSANQNFSVLYTKLQSLYNEAVDLNNKASATGLSATDKDSLTKQLDAKKAEFQAQQAALSSYKTDKEKSLSDTRVQIMQGLMAKIVEEVREVAKKHNASFALNSNGINSVLYASADYDATAEVLKDLNAAVTITPAPTPAADTSAKPASTSAAAKPASTSTK